MQLALLNVSIFLDVDDLEDVGSLEQHIEESALILIFVSQDYFVSKNCLREARHAAMLKKPLVLVHESDKT